MIFEYEHKLAQQAEVIRALTQENERLKGLVAVRDVERHYISNLLAIIHRDGGHYVVEKGFEVSCIDGQNVVSALREDRRAMLGALSPETALGMAKEQHVPGARDALIDYATAAARAKERGGV